MVDQVNTAASDVAASSPSASNPSTTVLAGMNVPEYSGDLPVQDQGSLADLILKVMLARGAALDNQVRGQVTELQKYTREMDNANRAQSAVQAAGSGSGGATCTFVWTNPETGQTEDLSVTQFVELHGDSISGKESNSDIVTTLNDIGTEAQGMSQEWSTNVSATMDKDNEAWEAGTNLVSSLNQTLQQLISKL